MKSLGRNLLMQIKKVIFAFLLWPALVLAYSSPGGPSGLVSDFAGMISVAEHVQLENKLVAFEKETGHEIAVVTVANLGGDTIENYAEELFKEWEIGKKNADNGVLLLVSRDDREMRIEVGYGLEGALTDTESRWILDEAVTPAFKAGRYYAGLDAGVDKIAEAIKGEIAVGGSSGSKKLSSGLVEFIFVAGWFLFVALASIFGRSKSWWAGGVVGGIIGAVIGLIKGFVFLGIIALAVLIPFGLVFDYFVSRAYQRSKIDGHQLPWWFGGGGFGGKSGGGFGGFGGGSSGGGGASSKW